MTPELKQQIRKASESLKILDIILFECSLSRPERDPEKLKGTFQHEHKRDVRFFLGKQSTPEGDVNSLQVLVSLGARLMPPSEPGREDPNAIFIIEADFLVNYEIKSEIDEECIKAFADNNAAHNVWPFWRQHVFDTISRARLPHLDIPLFLGFMA